VRVFYAVEHDDQGGGRRAVNQVIDAARLGIAHIGHDPLVHAAAGLAIEHGSVDALDSYARGTRMVEHRAHAVISPRAHAHDADATGT
jgi:hypothetical protein